MRIKRSELSKKYNITIGSWKNRHDDVLDHLEDFFPIQEIKTKSGRYVYEVPDELPDSIPPLPRKSSLMKEKQEDYKNYTLNKSLTEDFQPNSKAKTARDAMRDFGKEKYGHTNVEAVSRRFVGPVMEEYGEKSSQTCWVNYLTYKPLSHEEETYLMECFKKAWNKESAEEILDTIKNIGWDALEGIAPSKEDQDSYDNGIDFFKEKYGFRPIKVYQWRRRVESSDTRQDKFELL